MAACNEPGIAHAHGRTADLAELVRAIAAWFAGADPRGMKSVALFIQLPLMAEARAAGLAGHVVETHWKLTREAWSRMREFMPDQ